MGVARGLGDARGECASVRAKGGHPSYACIFMRASICVRVCVRTLCAQGCEHAERAHACLVWVEHCTASCRGGRNNAACVHPQGVYEMLDAKHPASRPEPTGLQVMVHGVVPTGGFLGGET